MNNEEFYLHIFDKHSNLDPVPSNKVIADWAFHLLDVLFPERLTSSHHSIHSIKLLFNKSQDNLLGILQATKACKSCEKKDIAQTFFDGLPELYRVMNTDIEAMLEGDPAAKNKFEIIRSYPGFLAISLYRIAHLLLKLGVPIIPRILTECAHSLTGIDIHPGATIGEFLYIDHGTGIVIGETTVIGDYVKLYQGVTLGALSVEKFMANIKRHPTIEDRVIIYAGATILGGDTIIGHDSIIGGNVWVTRTVPAGSTVYHQSTIKVIESKNTD